MFKKGRKGNCEHSRIWLQLEKRLSTISKLNLICFRLKLQKDAQWSLIGPWEASGSFAKLFHLPVKLSDWSLSVLFTRIRKLLSKYHLPMKIYTTNTNIHANIIFISLLISYAIFMKKNYSMFYVKRNRFFFRFNESRYMWGREWNKISRPIIKDSKETEEKKWTKYTLFHTKIIYLKLIVAQCVEKKKEK